MKVIEQDKYVDLIIKETAIGIRLINDVNDNSIPIDKQGAAELIKVLQEWINENH